MARQFNPFHDLGADIHSQISTELKYCAHCRKQTPHKVVSSETDGKGTGRDLCCTKCGSSRLGEIQGFDAELM